MRLIYEGTDITDSVDVVECSHRDVSGGRCDSTEIVLENAHAWYRWNPQRDDAIEIVQDQYTTGRLYLSAVYPEDGRYRILATSLPSSARRKANAAYANMRLGNIAASCAAECGMGSAIYGLDEDTVYACLIRNGESAPGFLHRILQYEGAVLKAYNGRLTAISVEYAQGLPAGKIIQLGADQPGVLHLRREEAKYAGLTIKTPFGSGMAADTGAPCAPHEAADAYPARSAAEAGRWARGLLLNHNRAAEELTLRTAFDPSMTAMARVDIAGATDAAGEWLVDSVEHNFIGKHSTIRMLRCIQTIQ